MMEASLEVKTLLGELEHVVEHSERKPRILVGVICIILGLWAVIEPFLYLFSSAVLIAVFLSGTVFLYISVWTLVFCKREYVCVTNKRVIYRKTNLLGGRGRVMFFPLEEITRARLCRTVTAFHHKSYSGHVLLVLENRKHYVLPFLQNGVFIVEAIRDECGNIAASDR